MEGFNGDWSNHGLEQAKEEMFMQSILRVEDRLAAVVR